MLRRRLIASFAALAASATAAWAIRGNALWSADFDSGRVRVVRTGEYPRYRWHVLAGIGPGGRLRETTSDSFSLVQIALPLGLGGARSGVTWFGFQETNDERKVALFDAAGERSLHGFGPWTQLGRSVSGRKSLWVSYMVGGVHGIRRIAMGPAAAGQVEFALPNGTPGLALAFGDGLAFAHDGADGGGRELWVADPADGSVLRVADLRPGPEGSDPVPLLDLHGGLLFTADDGNGRRSWLTDGTSAGTHPLEDLVPGVAGIGESLLGVRAGVAYIAGSSSEHGNDLWATDGSSGGTHALDLVSGAQGSQPRAFIADNSAAFIAARDASGVPTVWRTRGTPGTTEQLHSAGSAGDAIVSLDIDGRQLVLRLRDPAGGVSTHVAEHFDFLRDPSLDADADGWTDLLEALPASLDPEETPWTLGPAVASGPPLETHARWSGRVLVVQMELPAAPEPVRRQEIALTVGTVVRTAVIPQDKRRIGGRGLAVERRPRSDGVERWTLRLWGADVDSLHALRSDSLQVRFWRGAAAFNADVPLRRP